MHLVGSGSVQHIKIQPFNFTPPVLAANECVSQIQDVQIRIICAVCPVASTVPAKHPCFLFSLVLLICELHMGVHLTIGLEVFASRLPLYELPLHTCQLLRRCRVADQSEGKLTTGPRRAGDKKKYNNAYSHGVQRRLSDGRQMQVNRSYASPPPLKSHLQLTLGLRAPDNSNTHRRRT